MARRSQYEHLKPEVMRLFFRGASPGEVRQVYPAIGKSTIYDWEKEFRNRPETPDEIPESHSGKEAEAVTVEVMPRDSKLVALPTGDESDYQLARRSARKILKDDSVPAHTRVMAIGAIAKLIEMRYKMPPHILEETTKSTLDEQRDRLRDLPTEELARRYREAL